MLHSICDFCGKDTDRSGVLLTLTPFQNFARYHSDRTPYGTSDQPQSFIICSRCISKHNLPNPFENYAAITAQTMQYSVCLDNMEAEDTKEGGKS